MKTEKGEDSAFISEAAEPLLQCRAFHSLNWAPKVKCAHK